MDYGMEIYGCHGKSHLKLLRAPYHSAIRRSLRAFPTTPVLNILSESGLPSIQERIIHKSKLLVPKLFLTPNEGIFGMVRKNAISRRCPRILSAVRNSVCWASTHCPDLAPRLVKPLHPPWLLNKKSIDLTLTKYDKYGSGLDPIKRLFNEKKSAYQSWQFLYSDGSKTSNFTCYAVVDDNGSIISSGEIYFFSSIFTAEGYAILKAVLYAASSRGKYIICSDSLSVIKAVLNTQSSYYDCIIARIRNELILHPNKLKLMWVPAHIGIAGNERADSAAKNVHLFPHPIRNIYDRKDIFHLVKTVNRSSGWTGYVHHYTSINPTREAPIFPSTSEPHKLKVYIRLRLGHTKLTHEHILTGRTSSGCLFCRSSTTSIQHLLSSCPGLADLRNFIFKGLSYQSLLSSPSVENINSVYNFLKSCNLIRFI